VDATNIAAALTCGKFACICSKGKMVHCPYHDSSQINVTPSLSIKDEGGKVLVHCFNGCDQNEVIKALKDVKLWGGGANPSPDSGAQPHRGLTLEEYAAFKHLPLEFLQGLGLSTETHSSQKWVRTPYHSADGKPPAAQFRGANSGAVKHRWKSNDKPCLYGLDRLSNYKDYVVIVEGPSDSQTLMYNDIPVIGLPSATGWREDRDAQYFNKIGEVFVIIEPDSGGEAVKKWLSDSSIRTKAKLVTLVEDFKDPSEMWIADQDKFISRWERSLQSAIPWSDISAADNHRERAEAWELCKRLASLPNILDVFIVLINKLNLVGEDTAAKIVFLELISRFLRKPVNSILKGTSAGGKSFIVTQTLKLFREYIDYHLFSAMSDKAIINSDKDFRHKFLVIVEWQGMASDMLSYLIRTLMSEGRIKYEKSVPLEDGRWGSEEIIKEGPTGIIVTTTATNIYWENETRHLSLTIDDTQDQTGRVIDAISREVNQLKGSDIVHAQEIEEFLQLQRWLAASTHEVFIPYAEQLGHLISPVAVRLRRDYSAILMLIQASAVLHQATRETDAAGRIIATLKDYEIVKDLVDSIISAGIGRTVKESTRETFREVEALLQGGKEFVTNAELTEPLQIDTSSVSRRTKVAIADGYLINIQTIRGREHRLILGNALPEDTTLMPETHQLCSDATDQGEVEPPPSPVIESYIGADGSLDFINKAIPSKVVEA